MQGKLKSEKHETLTVEGLKRFKGLEGLSDETAEKALEHLRKLARLLIKACQLKRKKPH